MNPSSRLDLPGVIPLMNKLKLLLRDPFEIALLPFDSMSNLFSKMPNLSYLTIETTDINLDGNKWEKILIEYLPNIEVFQLNMNFNFDLSINKEEQVDKLLDSFRTSFWIEEHLWFVCCDWHPSPTNKYGFLYTLPYALDKYVYQDQICSKTTYPSHLDHSVYTRINTLKITVLEKDSVLNFNILPSKFPNIRHLDLCLSFNNNISSIILSFNHLTSLKISNMPYSNYYNCQLLQMLFDRAPHLNSLSLYQVLFHKAMIYKLTSTSIRRLEFISISKTNFGFLNTEECSTLINSPLGQQCEVLKVGVKNRLDIIRIVRTMCYLRSLTVQCDDDIQVFCRSFFSTHDRILKWLQQRLLFKYLITRDINDTNSIRIWIR